MENPRHRIERAGRPRSDESAPRFPIARQGYDRAIVDERFAELEQELSELDRELADRQSPRAPEGEATGTIDRLGEEISAILVAAHESAGEIMRLAEAEAAHRVAHAESRARSISEAAARELRDVQANLAALRQERERLLGDIRSVASALHALADTEGRDVGAEPKDEHPGIADA
ncbi:MAG: DivIVA domain-containing protein [Solirubrobacteraceae bacterium]